MNFKSGDKVRYLRDGEYTVGTFAEEIDKGLVRIENEGSNDAYVDISQISKEEPVSKPSRADTAHPMVELGVIVLRRVIKSPQAQAAIDRLMAQGRIGTTQTAILLSAWLKATPAMYHLPQHVCEEVFAHLLEGMVESTTAMNEAANGTEGQ